MPANTIFNGDVIGTASIASSVLPAGLPSGILSSSAQLPSGIVSSSAQVKPLLPGGTFSASSQVDYNTIQNKLSGTISSSAQFNTLSGTTASFATTASFVTNATLNVAGLWAYSNIL